MNDKPELIAVKLSDSPIACNACGKLCYYYLTRMNDLRLCDPCMTAAVRLLHRLRQAQV